MTEVAFDDLLNGFCAGDSEAATELVRRFEPIVRRFVRYRLTDPALRRLLDSLDICQSVFAQLFARLSDGRFTVSGSKQLTRLLLTMAGNKIKDRHRQDVTQRRGGTGQPVASDPTTFPDRTAGPLELAQGRDLIEVVRLRLTAEEQVWLDRRLAGQDWEEIAAAVDGVGHALRKRFTRAIDRVTRDLGWE